MFRFPWAFATKISSLLFFGDLRGVENELAQRPGDDWHLSPSCAHFSRPSSSLGTLWADDDELSTYRGELSGAIGSHRASRSACIANCSRTIEGELGNGIVVSLLGFRGGTTDSPREPRTRLILG